jgi:hypothetical protein
MVPILVRNQYRSHLTSQKILSLNSKTQDSGYKPRLPYPRRRRQLNSHYRASTMTMASWLTTLPHMFIATVGVSRAWCFARLLIQQVFQPRLMWHSLPFKLRQLTLLGVGVQSRLIMRYRGKHLWSCVWMESNYVSAVGTQCLRPSLSFLIC